MYVETLQEIVFMKKPGESVEMLFQRLSKHTYREPKNQRVIKSVGALEVINILIYHKHSLPN
jgi:hypothetical protein